MAYSSGDSISKSAIVKESKNNKTYASVTFLHKGEMVNVKVFIGSGSSYVPTSGKHKGIECLPAIVSTFEKKDFKNSSLR